MIDRVTAEEIAELIEWLDGVEWIAGAKGKIHKDDLKAIGVPVIAFRHALADLNDLKNENAKLLTQARDLQYLCDGQDADLADKDARIAADDEQIATLKADWNGSIEARDKRIAEQQAEIDCISQGVKDRNIALDVQAARVAELEAENAALREALEPFVKLSDERDAIYRKRGGDPDSFPDTHPSYSFEATQLPMKMWRRARATLRQTKGEG
jgi:hypothetical protein